MSPSPGARTKLGVAMNSQYLMAWSVPAESLLSRDTDITASPIPRSAALGAGGVSGTVAAGSSHDISITAKIASIYGRSLLKMGFTMTSGYVVCYHKYTADIICFQHIGPSFDTD